jgi:hypothetical protein
MAKFFDVVGFAAGSVETKPGVWVEQVIERQYYGDIGRPTRRLNEADKVNFDVSLTVGNSISILADGYASEHLFAIRYVRMGGTLWIVSQATLERPRIILELGGVYHGKTPSP